MPFLPLDHPEPYAATLGVMLYPGTDETERLKASALASLCLAEPLKKYYAAGHMLPHGDLLRIATDGGQLLDDVEERLRAGRVVGELLWIYFTLAHTHAPLASWNNAIKVAEILAARARRSGARSSLYAARARFSTVAHLWCAWCACGLRPSGDPNDPDSGVHALFELLTDAEYFLRWGQTWHQEHAGSAALPHHAWLIPDNFKQVMRTWTWREAHARIPHFPVPDDILGELKPAGRPRQAN